MNNIAMQLVQDMAWGEIPEAQEGAIAAREQLFVALVQRQSPFVFRVAFAVLRHVQDAEDVTQEAFLKVYRKGAWERIEDERAYLARVAWRLAITRRTRELGSVSKPDAESASPTPEQLATQAEWSEHIQNLVSALPEELKHPLVLSAVDELKSSEIGVILGIPEGTVRNRISRARQLLKHKLRLLAEARRGR